MIRIRRAGERGHLDHGWLDTYHTFSFGNYVAPEHMGFRSLRVINEDWVKGGGGFPPHPHRDMEIVTYILSGAIEHRDSMGNGSIIRPGEVQRMTAGTGVVHSEANPSRVDPVHLIQIWILPERRGLIPGYEQKTFSGDELRGRLRLVASGDGRLGSVTIHQDAAIHAARLEPREAVEHKPGTGRGVWIQVARGSVLLNGELLEPGDGAAIEGVPVGVEGRTSAEILLFDLA